MKKSLSLLIILTILWSLFFSVYKYFIWWIFDDEAISLQFLSWYISIWTIFAYISWSFIYEIIQEKKFHFFSAFFSIFFIILLFIYFYFPIFDKVFFISVITILLWFFYWMWWILRNILISTEIEKWYSSDTKINWSVNISFISSIIIWSIAWWFIVEKMWEKWFFVIITLLIIAIFIWKNLEKKENKKEINLKEKFSLESKKYLTDFLYIFKKYFIVMIFVWLLLVIATILSQKAIEFLVDVNKMKQSTASLLLLFSAVWSIAWNIFSMKIVKNKWLYFMIYSFLFALSTISLWLFISNFIITSVIAFLAWIFFWITYNLLESDFFKKIAEDNKKSYWWASLWIVVSFIITMMMFLIDYVEKTFWFLNSYIFLAIILFLIWIIIFLKNKINE